MNKKNWFALGVLLFVSMFLVVFVKADTLQITYPINGTTYSGFGNSLNTLTVNASIHNNNTCVYNNLISFSCSGIQSYYHASTPGRNIWNISATNSQAICYQGEPNKTGTAGCNSAVGIDAYATDGITGFNTDSDGNPYNCWWTLTYLNINYTYRKYSNNITWQPLMAFGGNTAIRINYTIPDKCLDTALSTGILALKITWINQWANLTCKSAGGYTSIATYGQGASANPEYCYSPFFANGKNGSVIIWGNYNLSDSVTFYNDLQSGIALNNTVYETDINNPTVNITYDAVRYSQISNVTLFYYFNSTPTQFPATVSYPASGSALFSSIFPQPLFAVLNTTNISGYALPSSQAPVPNVWQGVIINVTHNSYYLTQINFSATSRINRVRILEASTNATLFYGEVTDIVNNVIFPLPTNPVFLEKDRSYLIEVTHTVSNPWTSKYLTAPGSLTTGDIIWSSGVDGETPNVDFYNVVNLSLSLGTDYYWRYTLSNSTFAATYNTTNFSQLSLPIYLSSCLGKVSPPNAYINFTFIDENTLAEIPGAIDQMSWSYWLSNGGNSVNKTLLYNNASMNPGYPFCFNPAGQFLSGQTQVISSGTGYPARTRNFAYTNINYSSMVSQPIYLLNAGVYSTIVIRGSEGLSKAGVAVTASRDFGGVPQIVTEGTTDTSGTVNFYLNPNVVHTIQYSAPGCTTGTVQLNPAQSTFYFIISCGANNTQAYASPIAGIIYQRSPPNGIVDIGQINYSFFVFSTNQTIFRVRLDLVDLRNNNSIINQTIAVASNSTPLCTTTHCLVNLTYTTVDNDRIKGKLYVDLGSGWILLEGDAYWITIRSSNQNNNGLANALNDFKNIFVDWNSGTDDTCMKMYSNQTACLADPRCAWYPEPRDQYFQSDKPYQNCHLDISNKLEFSRIVFIFFIMAIGFALMGRLTQYDGSNPGSFLWIMAIVVWILSIYNGIGGQGFFYYSYLTGSSAINNFIFPIAVTSIAIGLQFQILKRSM